jgi:hypothetical protein
VEGEGAVDRKTADPMSPLYLAALPRRRQRISLLPTHHRWVFQAATGPAAGLSKVESAVLERTRWLKSYGAWLCASAYPKCKR